MPGRFAPVAFSALLMLAVLMGCDHSPPPLTKARVIEQLDGKTSLVFIFETGPDTGQAASTTCTNLPPLGDKPRAAIAAGWIERRCEDNRIQFQLTAEGRRRSPQWTRYTREGLANRLTESPRLARGPGDDDKEWIQWYVPAARYERVGEIVIERADRPERMRALVRGRWVPNDEGELLRQAGWDELEVREQYYSALFSLRDAGGGRYGRGAAWYSLGVRPY